MTHSEIYDYYIRGIDDARTIYSYGPNDVLINEKVPDFIHWWAPAKSGDGLRTVRRNSRRTIYAEIPGWEADIYIRKNHIIIEDEDGMRLMEVSKDQAKALFRKAKKRHRQLYPITWRIIDRISR